MASKARGRDPLAALFRSQAPESEPGVVEYTAAKLIPVALLEENPMQPRLRMDPEALQELADSIAARGLLQPILVRLLGDRYQVIAGHRRRAAARMLGLSEVPCVVIDVGDDDLLELALIENLLRENLDPLDEARAFEQLRERYGYSLRDIAQRINKHHEYVAMRLRLLRHPEVQEAVQQGMKPTVAERIARIDDAEVRNDILGRAARGERIKIKDVPYGGKVGKRESGDDDDDDMGGDPLPFRGRKETPPWEDSGRQAPPPLQRQAATTAYTSILQEMAQRLQALNPSDLPSDDEAQLAVNLLLTIRDSAGRHLKRLQGG